MCGIICLLSIIVMLGEVGGNTGSNDQQSYQSKWDV